MSIPNIISVILTCLTAIGAYIAWGQAKTARDSNRQATIARLFQNFHTASQDCLSHPELLYSIYGLDENIPQAEAINISHLGFLLDAFQNYYGEIYNNDFTHMLNECKNKSNFLTRILSQKMNQNRWEIIKKIFYGDFDSSFINAINDIIESENKKDVEASSSIPETSITQNKSDTHFSEEKIIELKDIYTELIEMNKQGQKQHRKSMLFTGYSVGAAITLWGATLWANIFVQGVWIYINASITIIMGLAFMLYCFLKVRKDN